MIHARFDVDVIDHHRVVSAGPAAAGVWWAAVCWTRKQQLDGRIPKRVILGFFGGDRSNAKSMATLIKVGLFIDSGDDIVIHNYAAKNETKEQIAERRSKTAKRVSDWRSKGPRNAVTEAFVTSPPPSVTTGSVPGSDSDSVSDQEIPEEIQDLTGSGDLGGTGGPPTVEKITAMQRYRAAYESGVCEITGRYAMQREQEGHLAQCIQAHAFDDDGVPLRGERLLVWLNALGADFAEDIHRKRPDEARYYSALGPKGALKWLNERALAARAKAVGS